MKRRTIAATITSGGFGLHSGEYVEVTLSPHRGGIVFIRDTTKIPATPENVIDTRLNTTLGSKGARIATVEHLMSALYGMGITDCIIEVSGDEIPSMDGSALPFVRMIQTATIEELEKDARPIVIDKPVRVEGKDGWIQVEPGMFSLSYEISFDNPAIGRQIYLYEGKDFVEEIAPARTFGLLRDVMGMVSMGLALGGGFHNALIFNDEDVLNPDGQRFEDECIRHKVLDMLGDLWLLGIPILGKFHAYKANHDLHVAMALKIKEAFDARR